jgi:hypothetical protein
MKNTVFAFCVLIGAALAAQEASIGLFTGDSWEYDFEGALVLPRRGESGGEVARTMPPYMSADGSVIASSTAYPGAEQGWKLKPVGSGAYEFYVMDSFKQNAFEWPRDLRVEVRLGSQFRSYRPPTTRGLVWHVCTIYADGIEDVNQIFPMPRLVRGYVIDAVTGQALSGARVSLIQKVGNAEVASALTDDNGRYGFVAPDGVNFTIKVSKDGYTSFNAEIAFRTEDFPRRVDAYLSGFMKKAQYRFVLSWGKSPSDLDAHLVGSNEGGAGEFHISYRNMVSYAARHFLDRDCVSGYGPETITLTRLDDGVYSYAVHDYSNLSSSSSARLSASGAEVRLYRESELIATWRVPEGRPGTLWRVCEIDGRTGAIKTLNEMRFESNPSLVR